MNTPINHLTAGFIGLGLIGGSIARGLKRSAPDIQIMAYMRTREKLEQAHADGIVDLILDGVDEHLSECDIIFLCTPVEFNESYLRQIRPFLKEGAVVTDVGSTKTSIHETVAALGMEKLLRRRTPDGWLGKDRLREFNRPFAGKCVLYHYPDAAHAGFLH